MAHFVSFTEYKRSPQPPTSRTSHRASSNVSNVNHTSNVHHKIHHNLHQNTYTDLLHKSRSNSPVSINSNFINYAAPDVHHTCNKKNTYNLLNISQNLGTSDSTCTEIALITPSKTTSYHNNALTKQNRTSQKRLQPSLVLHNNHNIPVPLPSKVRLSHYKPEKPCLPQRRTSLLVRYPSEFTQTARIMDEDSDIEEHLTREYDPVEVETSIALNKEVREWNENKESTPQCAIPILKTIFSIFAHIGFIGSMGVIAWSTQSELQYSSSDREPNYTLCYILTSVVASVLYIGILVEAAASDTYSYIKNYTGNFTAHEYLERTRDACPLIRWRSVCYHYEVDMMTDNKNSSVNTMRNKEKVTTFDDTEAFQFNKWRDLTRDIKGLFRLPIIRLECSKIFIFRDEDSKEKYMHQYVSFREKCRRRDEFMEHEETFTIPGFRDRLLLCSDVQRRPIWMRESVFWVMSVLLLTWPYRIFFSRHSTQVYVVFIKELDA